MSAVFNRFAAGAIVAAGLFAGGAAMASSGYMSCSSFSDSKSYCRSNVPLAGVKVKRVYSNAACRRGYSWGFDRNGIWVDHGCRAQFLVSYARFDDRYGYNDRGRRGGGRYDGYDYGRYDDDGYYRNDRRGKRSDYDDYGYGYDGGYNKGKGGHGKGRGKGYRSVSRGEAVDLCTSYALRKIRQDGGNRPRIRAVDRVRRIDDDSWRVRGTAVGRFFGNRRDCDFVCVTDGYRVTRFRFD